MMRNKVSPLTGILSEKAKRLPAWPPNAKAIDSSFIFKRFVRRADLAMRRGKLSTKVDFPNWDFYIENA